MDIGLYSTHTDWIVVFQFFEGSDKGLAVMSYGGVEVEGAEFGGHCVLEDGA